MADPSFDEKFLFSNFDSETGTEPEEDQLEGENPPITKRKKTKKQKKTSDDAEPDVSAQDKYIVELEQQNTKLKSIIKRMMGPQTFTLNHTSSDAIDGEEIDLVQKLENDIQSKPFAVVLFLNNDVSTVHRKEIDNVMKDISVKEAKKEVLLAQKLQPQNSAVPLKAFSANARGKRFNPGNAKDSEESYIVCACQYYKGFYIDRLGAPLLESNPDVADIWDVPAYAQVFFKALPILEEALNIRVKQMKQCFNCGGEHHLNECTEPKDQVRIRENRNKFTNTFAPARQKFQMEELDERFKHFKPGEISVELEEALGISLNSELPPYIYKMREIGYPPGWVKPAEDDGLKMYGADGNVVESADFEEGEIKNINIPDIISYPGFNAALPAGVSDEYEQMNLPAYNKDVADFEIAKKRAKVLGYFENEPLAKRLKFEATTEMEIDNDEVELVGGKPPLPLIDVTARPPSPKAVEELEKSTSKPDDETEEVFDGNTNEEKSGDSAQTPENKRIKQDGSQSLPRLSSSKDIDDTTYRHWYNEPFSSVGVTYVMYTPPPSCLTEVDLKDLPRKLVTDIDREPWKTPAVSWYFPLYGDLAAPTGTFDSIRTLLKETKRPEKKPML